MQVKDRPRLSFSHGVWTLTDSTAGYYRELTVAELNHLLADGYEHIKMCLRVATERPPPCRPTNYPTTSSAGDTR